MQRESVGELFCEVRVQLVREHLCYLLQIRLFFPSFQVNDCDQPLEIGWFDAERSPYSKIDITEAIMVLVLARIANFVHKVNVHEV